MKTAETDFNKRKLMDRLIPKPEFGPVLGCLATTYEMQTEFFELDFLPAVLDLGAWDDRSWTSRIELERRMSHLEAAVVFVDASRYRNRPRSLRVRIIPVLRTGGLHSKVVLLIYENAVRLILGSANLTEPGYRENREVVAVLTATEKKPGQGPLIQSGIPPMRKILDDWWNPECERLAEMATERLQSWKSGPINQEEWFAWGGTEKPLWKHFQSFWPDQEVIEKMTIVSPFWSEEAKKDPLALFVEDLTERGFLKDGVLVRLLTEATPDTQSTLRPTLPDSIASFDYPSLGVVVSAEAVNPEVLKEEVGMEGFTKARHLHAKVVLFEGENTSLTYVGSANFTRRGWGFVNNPQRANIEAGLIMRRTGRQRDELSRLIPKTTGEPIFLMGGAETNVVSPEPIAGQAPWPAFLKEVLLSPSVKDPDRLDLLLDLNKDRIEGDWSISVTGTCPDLNPQIFSSAQSDLSHVSEPLRIALQEEMLNCLLREQEVVVAWWETPDGRAFPINVDLEARYKLPMIPGRHRIEEKHLLSYYQGRITWEELFPERVEGSSIEGEGDDYEKTCVDTSHIQSYQIREFVEALEGITQDLKAASRASEQAMRLSLLGEVSPVGLAKLVMEAVMSGQRSEIAGGFQLVEILGCLKSAREYDTPDRYKKSWLGFVGQAEEEIERRIRTLGERAPRLIGGRSPFSKYRRSICAYYDKQKCLQ
ncbi:MAG: hypothetical protein SWQ30_12830 [Thermodesulfobacteriota bacterium]|nr:hypothetical protein [Thermodesulfobacteriota bacterium]